MSDEQKPKEETDTFSNIIPMSEEVAPLDKNGVPMIKFEVKQRGHPEHGIEKSVFVAGKKLDFKIDVNRFLEAKKAGPKYFVQVQKEIQDKFVKEVSDAVGRKVTVMDLQKATVTGWI